MLHMYSGAAASQNLQKRLAQVSDTARIVRLLELVMHNHKLYHPNTPVLVSSGRYHGLFPGYVYPPAES